MHFIASLITFTLYFKEIFFTSAASFNLQSLKKKRKRERVKKRERDRERKEKNEIL